jgi:hypothetical protein
MIDYFLLSLFLILIFVSLEVDHRLFCNNYLEIEIFTYKAIVDGGMLPAHPNIRPFCQNQCFKLNFNES